MKKVGIAIIIGLAVAGAASAQEPTLVSLAGQSPRAVDEILVQYRPGSAQANSLKGQGGIQELGITRRLVQSGYTTQAAAETWRSQPDVLWVQPNYWRYALAYEVTPNDYYYVPPRNQRRYQQWHLPKINANFAWSLGQGSDEVLVAVVDSGVDLNHPDLKARLAPGITLVNQEKYTPTAHGMDDNGHGTHIAGLIGAQTNNGVGVAGCTWSGKILPVKVLNKDGSGTDSDIAAGILWAADAGARVINLSLGAPASESEQPLVMQAAIDYAYAKGCLVIAAAGNSGDNTIHYPAALNHVLAVGATDPWDRRATYSTYGAFVDIAAPGGSGKEALTKETGILSTFWDSYSAIMDNMGGDEAGEYAITVGTSAAAGIVSGIAALVWSQYPDLTPDQLGDLLKRTAKDIGAPEIGTGRLDALAALGNPMVNQPELTLYNYPNPFNPDRETTQIVFLLESQRSVDLAIYDVSRDLVWKRHYAAPELAAGKNIKTWDGKNGMGEKVANGVYYVKLTAEGGRTSATKVIAVVR